MVEPCAHAGCKRPAHYGAECCRHAQLALPLQLALLDAAGQPLVEHHHDQEETEEVGVAACPISDCGRPAVSFNGFCQAHFTAALALCISHNDTFSTEQFDAIYQAHELELGRSAELERARVDGHSTTAIWERHGLGMAKLRLRLGKATPNDQVLLRAEAAEVNAGLAAGPAVIQTAPKSPKPAPAPRKRARKGADPTPPPAKKKRAAKPAPAADAPGACSVSLCARPGAAQGLCAAHYRKARRLGIPTTGTYTLAQVDLLSGRTKPPKERR
jgi:hypothetical protein